MISLQYLSMVTYKASERNWQTEESCTIYLAIYVVLMKYLPTIFIAGLNLAIAWKLKVIWSHRKQIRNRINTINTNQNFKLKNKTKIPAEYPSNTRYPFTAC